MEGHLHVRLDLSRGTGQHTERAQVALRDALADVPVDSALGAARRTLRSPLRSLANAAKLLDAHPALARQLLVEALPYGASLKVALGECAVGVMGPPRHPTRLS